MILTVPLGTAYTDHLTRPERPARLISARTPWQEPHDPQQLDDYRAELLPEDKSAAIRELREKHGVIAMVGDGVNDAPALANADLAIAMGAASTDVALETADVALMADELDRLPAAIRLSRRARNNIKINIALSLTVVAILIVAALAGWMSLTTGLLLNEGSAALIILNGLRMLRPGRGETRRAQVDFGTRQGSDLNSGRPCAPGSTTDGHSVAAGSSYDQREHGR
uniref:HAD-IC family P-type ATPase n=1 Tax=Micrococcus sp. KRD077 TaxID=2729720 RepID=UPI00237BBCEB|nr:HAD-IC family P-type ATPase [Micrococcus sp. KRD077]